MKEAKGIELFMFSQNGYKSIKFTSNGIKLGKMKIGPFEIPSNKILIASPKIFYY